MSNSRKIMLVVSRPGYTTVAVILADITERITKTTELQAAIIKAVTFWMCKTTEGADAYKRSSGHFNVGDLAGVVGDMGDAKLKNYLASLGVYNLDIDECEAGVDHWNFDDHLFVDFEVEACQSSGT